jgi:Terminase small subunit
MKTETAPEHLTLEEVSGLMNPRQYRFCLEYLACNNAREAYSRAYGTSSDPGRQAYKVRHNPLVEEFLAVVRQIEWENRIAEEQRKAQERSRFNIFEMYPRLLKTGRRSK